MAIKSKPKKGQPMMLDQLPTGSLVNPNALHHLPDDAEDAAAQDGVFRRIKVAYINPNPYQPRINVDPEYFERLKDDIAEHGIESPPVVIGSGRKYICIHGHTRIQAARELGWDEVLVRVHPKPLSDWNPELLAIRAIAENMLRSDLTDLEKAKAIQSLTDRYGLSSTDAARKTGIPPSSVRGLRLLVSEATPEVLRQAIEEFPRYYTVGRVKGCKEPAAKAVDAAGEAQVAMVLAEAAKEQWMTSALTARLRQMAGRRTKKDKPKVLKMPWGKVTVREGARGYRLAVEIKRSQGLDQGAVERAIQAMADVFEPLAER